MSPLVVTIVLFIALMVGLVSGLPIVFVLGSLSVIFSFLLWGPMSLTVIASKTFSTSTSFILVAVPMFILMANVLERSGVADDLYDAMYKWLGPVRGGLAIGTVLICTVFAAMSGLSAPAVITVGLISIPRMLKRGYDKGIAIGSIAAGGALGALIPPSIMMILVALFTNLSIGKMFIGGILPGIILSGLFCLYIGIRSLIQPQIAPALPKEERVIWIEKITALKSILLPVMIVFLVLGTIFAGITTPSEASAMGAVGAIVSAAIHRKLKWPMLKESIISTAKITGMALWLVFAAGAFSQVYSSVGGPKLIEQLVTAMPGGAWGAVIFVQVVLLISGCFLEPTSIIMITVPVFFPAIVNLGFDPLWFGIVYVVNLEMSYITPPFGFNLFYLKSILPENVSMADVYRSVIPFVFLDIVGLAIVMIFPQVVLWLPNMLIK
jgi:tripartite ATP-independent transporter DctM subunit